MLALVIAEHLGLLAAALSLPLREATSPTWVSTTTMISEAPIELTAPRLTPALEAPDTNTKVSVLVEMPLIVDAAHDTDAQHSAPVLITSVPPDALRAFAQRAGLKDDEQVTVLLRVQVLAEGTAREVVIEKSGGTPLIDAVDQSYQAATGYCDTLTYPTSTSSYRLKLQYDYQNGQLNRVKDFNAPATVFWQANSVDPRGTVTDETFGNGLQSVGSRDLVTE